MAVANIEKVPRESGLMPVSTDALVLADFVELKPQSRVLDLGSGIGAVAMALAAREKVSVVGVDHSVEAVEAANQRLERERPLLKGACEFLVGDLRYEAFVRELGPFQLVVCNPPYYKAGNGRLPLNPARASARHETTWTFEEIVHAAAWALGPGGVFAFIHIPPRLGEILRLLDKKGFCLSALQPVYTRERHDAQRVLVRASKGQNGALRVLSPRQLRALGSEG